MEVEIVRKASQRRLASHTHKHNADSGRHSRRSTTYADHSAGANVQKHIVLDTFQKNGSKKTAIQKHFGITAIQKHLGINQALKQPEE